MVAGRIVKWKDRILGFDIPHLKKELERSRDYLFNK